MSKLSRNGFGRSSSRTESLWVLTIRPPLASGSVPMTNAAIVRSRFTAYQLRAGAHVGLRRRRRPPLEAAGVEQLHDLADERHLALGAADELLVVVAEAHHLGLLRRR